MTFRTKTVIAATALSLGLAAGPASAQFLGGGRAVGYDSRAIGYNDDGTLNVFGAHIAPPASRDGGLVGNVVGGVGNVVGGVGSAVGGVVGGVTGAADDVVTGSIGSRSYRTGAADGYGRADGVPAAYGRGVY